MIDTPQKKLHVEAPYKTKVNSIVPADQSWNKGQGNNPLRSSWS